MAEQSPRDTQTLSTQRFLLFRLEKELFALPADMVSEVIRTPAAARVPQAPPALLGIANLRGLVLPLISLRTLLGLTPNVAETPFAIVLTGDSPISIAVDVVETLITVPLENVKSRDAQNKDQSHFSAAFSTDIGIAKIVDLQILLDTAFAARATAQKQMREGVRMERYKSAVADSYERNSDADVLVTFEVAGQEFALALADVREIVPAPDTITAVAQSESLVLGMMVLRDELLPVLSLRGLLGFGISVAKDEREKVVVAESAEQ